VLNERGGRTSDLLGVKILDHHDEVISIRPQPSEAMRSVQL
jgi:hypothetical protein